MNDLILNFILALGPIILLIIIMMGFKQPAWKAAIGAAVLAAIEAFFIWHQPVSLIGMSALEGAAMALWPIVVVIIG